MELTIRLVTEKDLPGVLDVERNAFPLPWTEEMFLGDLQSDTARYFLAETEGRVVGYAGSSLIVDEVHIANIAVHSDYRQRGIGRALLAHLIEKTTAEGANYFTLEVRRNNLAAQALYESQGFSVKGVRKNYYGNEDALIMIKE